MTEQTTTEVQRQIVVPAAIERAFTVFTERFGDFNPAEHNLLGAPVAETRFEPWVGGHLYDRAVDGTECRWARILAYDPPTRVVFSWDIGPTWQLETDPANTSEVEVTFTAESAERTRVTLVHRHIDRHGTGWESVAEALLATPAGRSTSTGTPPCSPVPSEGGSGRTPTIQVAPARRIEPPGRPDDVRDLQLT